MVGDSAVLPTKTIHLDLQLIGSCYNNYLPIISWIFLFRSHTYTFSLQTFSLKNVQVSFILIQSICFLTANMFPTKYPGVILSHCKHSSKKLFMCHTLTANIFQTMCHTLTANILPTKHSGVTLFHCKILPRKCSRLIPSHCKYAPHRYSDTKCSCFMYRKTPHHAKCVTFWIFFIGRWV